MSDDFGYLNARIRIRRGLLLHEGFFREALTFSFSEMVKVLEESVYGPDLTGDALAHVDRAVSNHLNRTVADLPRLVSGEAREAVVLLLMRADLINLKTILRGKEKGASREEILGRLGAGVLPRSLYGAMVEAQDAAAISQLLSLPRHPLAGALREAVSAAREPLEMEVALDRAFYAWLLRRARELDQPYLSSFMTFGVDALNVATGVKLSALGFEGQANRLFLRGGLRVDLSLFERLAEGETAALEELSDTDFHRVSEARDLASVERGLRCALLAKAREGAKDALGAGLAVDYIQRKEWEAGRIRLLARRAYYNLPPSSVEKEVFCE